VGVTRLAIPPSWLTEDAELFADRWVGPDETREQIIDGYRRAWTLSDDAVREAAPDTTHMEHRRSVRAGGPGTHRGPRSGLRELSSGLSAMTDRTPDRVGGSGTSTVRFVMRVPCVS